MADGSTCAEPGIDVDAEGHPGPAADSAEDVLLAVADVSRRINDLARELNCLGYFDDGNSGRPRAA